MLSAGEDALETVLKPRFILTGGDPSRLHVVHSVRRLDENGKVVDDAAALDTDCDKLAKVLEQDTEIQMIVIDPITNHLGDVKTNFEEEVRPVLMKLTRLAEQCKTPVVMIGHLNRRERGTAALDRMLGARAFSGVPRTIYLTGPDNDATEKHHFVLAQERGLAHKGWKYRTELATGQADGTDIRQVRIVWEGQTEDAGQDVVDTMTREEKTAEQEAATDLRAYLLSQGGYAPAQDCKRQLGFPKVNWVRVRDKAGIETAPMRGEGRKGNPAMWTLKDATP
jgi:hypothetical protein